MTDRILTFPVAVRDAPDLPVPEVVEHLRSLLAQAEAGEIRGIAVASALRGQQVRLGTAWGASPVLTEIVTGSTMLQKHILDLVETGKIP